MVKKVIRLRRLIQSFSECRAVTRCREAAAGDGEKVASNGSIAKTFLKKIEIISKTPGGLVWGSEGSGLGLWGAVGLEKPIDSMTWRISPSPVFLLGPGFARARLVHESEKLQKPREMLDSSRKWPFFGHKLSHQGISELHLPKLAGQAGDMQEYSIPSWPAGRPNSSFESNMAVVCARNGRK